MVGTLRKNTVEKLASDNKIEISEDAAQIIASGLSATPNWVKVISSGLVLKFIAKQWRKAVITVFAARQLQLAGRYYVFFVLFDHYCHRYHQGVLLDEDKATALRRKMEKAVQTSEGGFGRDALMGSASAGLKLSMRLPVRLLSLVSRKGEEAVAAKEVESAVEGQMGNKKSRLASVVAKLEGPLSPRENEFLAMALQTFDSLMTTKKESASE